MQKYLDNTKNYLCLHYFSRKGLTFRFYVKIMTKQVCIEEEVK